MMQLIIVIGILVLAQIPMTELVFEDNSLSGEYCIVDCGSVDEMYSSSGTLLFDGERILDAEYSDSLGRSCTLTISLRSYHLSDGDTITIQCNTGKKVITATGEVSGSACYIDIEGIASGSGLKIWGSVSDKEVTTDVVMSVTAIPNGSGISSTWMMC